MVTGELAASGKFNVRLGDAAGNFGAATTYQTGSTNGLRTQTLYDFDQDGNLDVLSLGFFGTNILTVHYGLGDGSFAAPTSIPGSVFCDAVVVGDFNNDGHPDFVTSTQSGYAQVFINQGDQTFLKMGVNYSFGATLSRDITAADFNGDGSLDVALAVENDGGVRVLFGNGDGSLGNLASYSSELYTQSVETADLNGDGVADLISAGATASDGFATVRLGIGDGTFASAVSYKMEEFSSSSLSLADINSDGVLDLITSGEAVSGGARSVTFRLGKGDGSFGDAVSNAWDSMAFYQKGMNFADTNRDGVLDAVYAKVSGGVDIRLGSTRSGVAPLLDFSLGTQNDSKWAMSLMEQKLEQLSAQRSTIGSFQSRLGYAVNNLRSMSENYSAAESRIRDADIAFESAALLRLQILQQAGASILAQANQQPALALRLLQN